MASEEPRRKNGASTAVAGNKAQTASKRRRLAILQYRSDEEFDSAGSAGDNGDSDWKDEEGAGGAEDEEKEDDEHRDEDGDDMDEEKTQDRRGKAGKKTLVRSREGSHLKPWPGSHALDREKVILREVSTGMFVLVTESHIAGSARKAKDAAPESRRTGTPQNRHVLHPTVELTRGDAFFFNKHVLRCELGDECQLRKDPYTSSIFATTTIKEMSLKVYPLQNTPIRKIGVPSNWWEKHRQQLAKMRKHFAKAHPHEDPPTAAQGIVESVEHASVDAEIVFNTKTGEAIPPRGHKINPGKVPPPERAERAADERSCALIELRREIEGVTARPREGGNRGEEQVKVDGQRDIKLNNKHASSQAIQDCSSRTTAVEVGDGPPTQTRDGRVRLAIRPAEPSFATEAQGPRVTAKARPALVKDALAGVHLDADVLLRVRAQLDELPEPPTSLPASASSTSDGWLPMFGGKGVMKAFIRLCKACNSEEPSATSIRKCCTLVLDALERGMYEAEFVMKNARTEGGLLSGYLAREFGGNTAEMRGEAFVALQLTGQLVLELTSEERKIGTGSFGEDFPLSSCVCDAMVRAFKERDLVREMGGPACVLARGAELYRQAVEPVEEFAVLDTLRQMAENKARSAKTELLQFCAEVGTNITGTHVGEGSGPSVGMEPPTSHRISKVGYDRRLNINEWAHEVRSAFKRNEGSSLENCHTVTSMREVLERTADTRQGFGSDSTPHSLETIQPLLAKAKASRAGSDRRAPLGQALVDIAGATPGNPKDGPEAVAAGDISASRRGENDGGRGGDDFGRRAARSLPLVGVAGATRGNSNKDGPGAVAAGPVLSSREEKEDGDRGGNGKRRRPSDDDDDEGEDGAIAVTVKTDVKTEVKMEELREPPEPLKMGRGRMLLKMEAEDTAGDVVGAWC